ncbi:TetR/AcrR family transcriptional regulator [Nocardia sp. NBC_01503]|uniref:TetR/AcrR family transcriptional regulator n=1 Tax=Nocardia sp. NBC_01503 TaxID=2975997 RepID=UPI002E7AEC90|nr:TetR/AcrR family transcriptional regulator [Nocardia sp. NBC_01503]WTL31161.1 TetR/AcrR family transcriptional regulator [Nocardia sp. NBC_01503]
MTAVAPRRTQAERSAATRSALVDATIEAIAEVGYHNASLGEISRRAGISKGAIFRHFDSRTDLVVAAADEVRHRHIRAVQVLRRPENSDRPIDLADIMLRVRTQVRDQTNTVWFELLVAARTEPELRDRLAPVARGLLDEVEEMAVAALCPAVTPETAKLLATSLIHMFDGEAIFRSTYPRPELEDSRISAARYIAQEFFGRDSQPTGTESGRV